MTSRMINTGLSSKLLVLLATLALGACGTQSGEETALNPTAPTPPSGANYTGPAPSSNDAQNFKTSLWDNITISGRCAGCHSSQGTGQNPLFADTADVNTAHQAAGSVVNMDDPSLSRLVIRAASGHGCWLGATGASACADLMTTWISNWAGGSAGSVSQVALRSPEIRDVSATKEFPDDTAAFGANDGIYHLLTTYCSDCHVEGEQTPYLASANIQTAYTAAKPRINLETPRLSRLVERLRNDFHNCWDGSCVTSSQLMEDAIDQFSQPIEVQTVDPALVISKALNLTEDGIAANTGGRYEDNIIAKYEFKTGEGLIAFDTSGVEPALDLTLSGNTEWVGGWGVRFGPASGSIGNGKAQGTTTSSIKLYNQITATGEYAIEAWVIPGNVTQEDARIITYSGANNARNFTLGQTLYNYDVLHRSSTSDQNEAFSTPDAAQRLQATLQHVVVTYTPGEGRRIYVNGQFTGDVDPDAPGTFANWNDNYAFVLGNETDSDSLWQGTVRMVAIHNRALNAEQIAQNYDSGVGEKFFMLFSITDLISTETPPENPDSFIVFQVSQFDSYSYLFTEPFFVSLQNSTSLSNIPIQGMQIGINGELPPNGQAYKNLNYTLNQPDYTANTYVPISPAGTIIELRQGPDIDEMFLSFERIGNHTHVVTEAEPPASPAPANGEPVSDIGLKTFDEINASMSVITGIPKTRSAVANTFTTIRQQLPTVETIDGFLSAHQMAITQLAIQYCNELVEDDDARTAYFPGFNFNATAQSTFDSPARALITGPLLDRGLGIDLDTQPDNPFVETELNALISKLLECGGSCDTTQQTRTIAKATCAAVLGSASTLIQ